MGYRPALDGLRAVAIGLVLLEHTGLEVFDGGNSGVVLFFVLSGFLITKLMVEEWETTGTLDIRAFYGRRAVRIMPAPLVMTVVLFTASWYLAPRSEARHYLWFELVMVACYLTNLRPLLFGDSSLWGARFEPGGQERFTAHTWSLSVEEHFYLVWPWVLRRLRLPDRPARRVVQGLLGFVAAVTLARYVLDRWLYPDLVSVSVFTFDGFALGAALAFALHFATGRRATAMAAHPLAFSGALLWLAADLVLRKQADGPVGLAGGSVPYQYWHFTTIGLVGLVVVAHLAERPDGRTGRLLAWSPVVTLGKLSYSLYLWHVPIQVAISRDRFPTWSLWQIVALEQTLTVVAAVASYRLVERPARRLRRRFVVAPVKSPSGSLSTDPG
jgi:peptidoglycan/LPS O-acetylase OafA/YrhL